MALAAAIVLWLLGVSSIWVSDNLLLLPAVLLAGALLAPATLAVWASERGERRRLTTMHLVVAMSVGGGVSFLVAGVVGTALLQTALPAAFRAGLVEELAKLLAVAAIAWRLRLNHARDGILLGVAVGLGYAVLENSGYALAAFAQAGDSVHSLLTNQLSRTLQTPVTHVLWTALAGGALLAAAGSRVPRWLRLAAVASGYLLAAGLHAYWDVAAGVSWRLASGFAAPATGSGVAFMVTWDAAWFLLVGVSSLAALACVHSLWRFDRLR